MDIPPPPSPEDQPKPPGGHPAGPPPPPPAPSPYGAPAPPYASGRPYGYPQTPYAQPSPYGTPDPAQQQPQQQPPYGANPYPQQGNPYAAPGSPGPYGPYPGGMPYPVPQQGWYAADRTVNGLSIASLVTAFTCVPFLALGLGIGGIKQSRRTGQRGRGLAISGITINSLTTVLAAVLITLGALGVLDDGNTRVQDIKAGQCFNTVGHTLADYEQGKRASDSVNVVSCDKEHDAEAFYTFTLDPSLGKGYPGATAVSLEASAKCSSQVDDYLDGRSLKDGMKMYYFVPPKSVWDGGDRSGTCFFGSRDGKVTGSVKSGGGSPDDGSDGGSSDDGGDSGVGV